MLQFMDKILEVRGQYSRGKQGAKQLSQEKWLLPKNSKLQKVPQNKGDKSGLLLVWLEQSLKTICPFPTSPLLIQSFVL